MDAMNLKRRGLDGVQLGGAMLQCVQWGGKSLVGADLAGADLRGADLSHANLREANLGWTNLGGANLVGANLPGASLIGANLAGADLREAYLQDANLSFACLRGAGIEHADLGRADLSGADLREARLDGVSLRSADLHEANLFGVNLDKASGLTSGVTSHRPPDDWSRASYEEVITAARYAGGCDSELSSLVELDGWRDFLEHPRRSFYLRWFRERTGVSLDEHKPWEFSREEIR